MSIGITSVQSIKAVNSWIGIIDANIEGTPRTAYKSTRVHITDGLAANRAPRKLGDLSGVQPTFTIQSTSLDFTQGQIHQDEDRNRMAISGEGFFILSDRHQRARYSRDGDFAALPGDHFQYLANSRGLYLNDTAMAINMGVHEEHNISTASVNLGFGSGVGWVNAQERLVPPLTSADFDAITPKPIWVPLAANTSFQEAGGPIDGQYRHQTAMLRKSFVANTTTFQQNNALTIEVPGQTNFNEIPRFYDAAGNRFATAADNITLYSVDPALGVNAQANLENAMVHPMATQVWLNDQLVAAYLPNATGAAVQYQLNNTVLGPYIQDGMNTLAIRNTEFDGQEGILVDAYLGGETVVSDSTWATQIVGTADAGGFVSINGQPMGGPLMAGFPYIARHDRVGVYAAGGGFLGGANVLDNAANFAANYQVAPPAGSDGDDSAGLPASGEDPDGYFRLIVNGNRTITNFEVFQEAFLNNATEDPEVDVAGQKTALRVTAEADNDTTLGNFDDAGFVGVNKGAPVAIWEVSDDGAGDVNFDVLVNDATQANGINYQINGSKTLQFYVPDMDVNPLISYLRPGSGSPLKVKVDFTEDIEINGNLTTVNYTEVYEFTRNGGNPVAFPVANTPQPLDQNFQGHPNQRSLVRPDYDDLVLARFPNKQGLAFSEHGSTIFEVKDGTGVNTTGVFYTGRPQGADIKVDATGADVFIDNEFGRVLRGHLEQSNASLTEYIPTLALAQKVFSSISKILNVFISEVDDLNGLIR